MKHYFSFPLSMIMMLAATVVKPTLASDNHPRVRLQTNQGDIVLELDREKAPKTVANFLDYVKEGHYDGTIFHRVIPKFVIQGGGFTADYVQKPTKSPVVNEARADFPNNRGTISMARTQNPNSATVQFFISLSNNEALNPGRNGAGYAVFGHVVQGMEVVDKIAAIPTGRGGPFPAEVPKETVIVTKATLLADETPPPAKGK